MGKSGRANRKEFSALFNMEFSKNESIQKFTRESYENELDFYNDEYYDQSDYQFIDYGEFNNIPAIPEHGYNGYVNNKYIGHGSDINGFVDPTLMLLIGLVFCLCFVLTGVFSMISGACCYVFSRYKYNEFVDNHIAVSMQTSDTQYIKYNNFISNDYSFELGDSQVDPQPNCNYNYYGIN
eukprot:326199_1